MPTDYVNGELEVAVAEHIRAEASRNGQLADEIARQRSRRWQKDRRPTAGRDLAGSAPAENAQPEVARRERLCWASTAITTTCVALYAMQPWASAPDIAWHGGQLVADGKLAQSLDDGVQNIHGSVGAAAIEEAAASPYEGACRSFQTMKLSGVACRDAERWVIAKVARRGIVGDPEQGPAIADPRLSRREAGAVPDESEAPSSGLD